MDKCIGPRQMENDYVESMELIFMTTTHVWDGFLFMYKEANEKNENYFRIPLQL